MLLDCQNPGELRVNMLDYLKVVLEDLPEVITGRSTSTTANILFQVRPEYKEPHLNKETATAFHHTVAQLIFVTSSSRKDTNMAIDFLCTQVRIPDENEWGKLVRVLRYIRGTLHMPLILRAYSLSVIQWSVDVYFSAQSYCKGHTGAMMSMGSGSIIELSWKQKINGRSSTESKIFGDDDVLTQCLW